MGWITVVDAAAAGFTCTVQSAGVGRQEAAEGMFASFGFLDEASWPGIRVDPARTLARNVTGGPMPWDVQVMLDDRPGALARVAGVAAEAHINLEGVCTTVCEGRGFAHLLVDEGLLLEQVLEAAGYDVVAVREVLLVEVENRPGALAELCGRLAQEGVNLELAYTAQANRFAMAVDEPEKARPIL